MNKVDFTHMKVHNPHVSWDYFFFFYFSFNLQGQFSHSNLPLSPFKRKKGSFINSHSLSHIKKDPYSLIFCHLQSSNSSYNFMDPKLRFSVVIFLLLFVELSPGKHLLHKHILYYICCQNKSQLINYSTKYSFSVNFLQLE